VAIDPKDLDGMDEASLDRMLNQLETIHTKGPGDYQPHAKQMSFHTAVKTTRVVLGGNRSGKTTSGAMEAWYHASGDYPDWYPAEQRFTHPTRGRIIVTDFKKGCGEVLEPKLRECFPPDRVLRWQRYMGHLEKIKVRHTSGGVSSIDIMTHEQDDMVFEGWSGHWAWFDEPPPQSKYIATKRGLVDYNGIAWLTLTPISEPWLWDELLDRSDDRVWSTVMTIFDNPHLSAEAIAEFESILPDEEREARIFGRFKHLVGRVYKDLDASVHFIDEQMFKNIWSPRNPVYFVLDPADRREQHGIWATVDPMNNIYIFDELCEKGTISETCRTVKNRETARWGIKSDDVIRILDPNKGMTPNSVTGLKLVDEFAKDGNGLYFSATVNDDVRMGHLAVMDRLKYDKKVPISSTNHPKLYFVRGNTVEVWSQMSKYVWSEWKGNTKSSRSEKEVPLDLNKDMPDCVRYLIMSDPQWYDQSQQAEEPQPLSFRAR